MPVHDNSSHMRLADAAGIVDEGYLRGHCLNILGFVAKHWPAYLGLGTLAVAVVLTFATMQMSLLNAGLTPRYYAIPTFLGILIGLLLATLYALRRELIEGQRMFRAVADMAQEFIYIRRTDGSYEYVSPSCEQVTGYPAAEFYASPDFMSDIVHPEDRHEWERHIRHMDDRGLAEKLVIRIRTRDDQLRWIEHMCSAVRDAQGNVIGVRSTNLDITRRVEHELELSVAAAAFETHEAIIITDSNSRILRVNRAFTDITGYEPEEVVGKSPSMFKSGRHNDAFYAEMWAALNEKGQWSGELWDRRKNGEVYPKYLTITAVSGKSGEVAYYVGIFSDMAVRKAAEEEIKRLAYYDSVTRLPNRRLLIERLAHATAPGRNHRRHGALLFIDVDDFKSLNDTRGHEIGDQLLIDMATSLMSCLRPEDMVARLGGDEFVVLIEDLEEGATDAAAQVEAIAEKILSAINRPYLLKEHPYHSTSSIGVAMFRGSGKGVEELLKHADVALYRAKDAGRGRLRFYDPAMQAALDSRAMLEDDLREAIARKQFELHYQPQVDYAGKVIGAEALLRWKHPERGYVMPAEFIPFAEECGLIIPIGQWVLEAACAQIKAWEEHPLAGNLPVAVNVSASQFMQADFVGEIVGQLKTSKANPNRLKLELTESALIDGIDEVVDKMRLLKAASIGFSLDDFGTGYSSLSYLRRLPLDQLKIDRSFVSDITTNPSDVVIAQTIIGMARNLGLGVIAEGVETREQLELLYRQGCRGFQGFLISRPVPGEEFERLLSNPGGLSGKMGLGPE